MFKKTKNNEVHAYIMEQIKDVEACMRSFENFIRAASSPGTDAETLEMLCNDVCKKEDVADRSLRRMIDSLVGTSFLPSTREDLISIATSCDKVANKCESVALMAVYQHFRFPEDHANDLLKIISITHKQFDLLEESISLLFAKFGELLKDHAILDQIRALETEVDIIEQNLYKDIFRMDMDLAHQTQLAHYVDELCDLSDQIEDIADKIQIMLVTRKN
jgi:predicted phosphate transport protein (TIGR00153 family)